MAAGRVLAGLTQSELAAQAGLNISVVSKYEAGLTVMRDSNLERIERALRAHGIRFLGQTTFFSMGVVLEKKASARNEAEAAEPER